MTLEDREDLITRIDCVALLGEFIQTGLSLRLEADADPDRIDEAAAAIETVLSPAQCRRCWVLAWAHETGRLALHFPDHAPDLIEAEVAVGIRGPDGTLRPGFGGGA